MFGKVKKLEPKDTFIDSTWLESLESKIESQLQVYEYDNPKYQRHRCKLLKKAKLPPSEVDYMVGQLPQTNLKGRMQRHTQRIVNTVIKALPFDRYSGVHSNDQYSNNSRNYGRSYNHRKY